MKITGTVLFMVAALAGCTTPVKDRPVDSAPSSGQAPAPRVAGSEPLAAGARPSPLMTAASSAAAPPAPAPSTPATPSGSAYVGCGEPIPHARLWDETTESEVLDAISSAKACAAEHGRRLLLEFVAPWCEDCQEMAKLDETDVVASTLRQRFERVRINVGKWDRHEGLRNTFGVHALATYIVIDPKTSKELAKTTLEPITKKGQKLSAEQWAAWLREH